MKRPLVTVLIDSYNYGHFIEEAIDSVLAQDFSMEQVEILVVDDGSTDDTADRVRKYGSKVRYLYKPNGGQASAFNMGFQHAKGEIVALLDADDYFLPHKLRRTVEELQKHPDAAMVYHGRMELDAESGGLVERRLAGFSGFLPDDNRKLFRYIVSPTSCMAFRRQPVEQLLPVPENIRLQADTFLGLLIVLVAPVIALAEPLCVYRIHGQNLYYLKDSVAAPERLRRHLDMFTIILGEAKTWSRRHKAQLKDRDSERYLNARVAAFQELRFKIDPPGRLRAFLFLLRQNYVFSPLQTRKFTIFNYLTAFSGLVLGYGKTLAWRDEILGRTQRWLGKISRASATKGSKEKANREPGAA